MILLKIITMYDHHYKRLFNLTEKTKIRHMCNFLFCFFNIISKITLCRTTLTNYIYSSAIKIQFYETTWF